MPRKNLLETYDQAAARRAWQFRGPLPRSEDTPTNWLCNNRHELRMSLADVRRLKDCPICKDKKW